MIIASPWDGDTLALSVVQWRHLNKVLRLDRGDHVTYTDGLGRTGSGRLGSQVVERGEEREVPRPRELTVAVAPPSNRDRQRFLVEKLAELGVARLVWLGTRHGKDRPAPPAKVFNWALAAVEQSRGAWLMETGPGLASWDGLEHPIAVCDADGGSEAPTVRTVVIGPEGGWAPDEIPAQATRWSLGPNVLRVETAAMVAAARLLSL
jgi:16S rRNA (uracil1498-N3)-methyltransferase